MVVYRLITGQSVESRVLHKANEKLRLELLVIQKGDFKRRQNISFTEDDLNEVIAHELGDAELGRERPITDSEVRRSRHRTRVQLCLPLSNTP